MCAPGLCDLRGKTRTSPPRIICCPMPTEPARASAAILIVVFFSLITTARLILKTPRISLHSGDEVSLLSDQRFAEMKKYLPSRGVVGYLGDPGNFGLPNYYLAQYALAPLVIDRSTNHALVIGNFSTEPPKPDTRGLEAMKTFDPGLVLFRNKDAH